MNGIIRSIDYLGRCVVPIEFRRELGLSAGNDIEITLHDDHIEIRNPAAVCVICGSKRALYAHPSGKHMCALCIQSFEKV